MNRNSDRSTLPLSLLCTSLFFESRKEGTLMTSKKAPAKRRGAELQPIGVIRSTIATRAEAPKQGREGAPDAWLEMRPEVAAGLEGLKVGSEVIVVTWLHQAKRTTLKVYPRGDRSRGLTGVFMTRSPDRPNPLGLHRVTVRSVDGTRLRIGPIEVIDGTPVVDIKPALSCSDDI
jgi:tRNA-Thr(GGU) m(6)t(6)A37 methyltransferase TsaA